MKKLIGFLILAILIGLLGWQIYQKVQTARGGGPSSGPGGRPGGPGRGNAAVAVEVAEVQQRSIRDIGNFTGSLLPKSQFILTPKVSGRLKQLLVDVGDRVERGQLIAVLEDDVFRQELDKARAELDVARANYAESLSALAVALREFERAQTLSRDSILSQSGLDSAQAKYDAALARQRVSEAQIASRESSVKTAKVRLADTKIHASWESGEHSRVVGERFVDEGAILKANEAIVSILDISSITCVINVIERDYFKIQHQQKVTLTTDAIPGREFQGTVARIAPLLQEKSRQARVELDVPNPDEILKPGMFVRVRIEFRQIQDATIVPAAALVMRHEVQGVFRTDLEKMTAHFVPVTVGVVTQEFAQILEPAISGSVVTLGQYLLEDGTGIMLPEKQESKPQKSGAPRQDGRTR